MSQQRHQMQVHRLKPHIHLVAPVLACDGEFRRQAIDLPDNDAQSAVNKLLEAQAIEHVRREADEDTRHAYQVYRWHETVKRELQAYIEQMDRLPCACRVHIPDARDDPTGRISCRYCDAEYDEQWFKEFVEERL